MGDSVILSGALSDKVACIDSAYSFELKKIEDGTFKFSVAQTNPALVTSSAVAFTWIRDTLAPNPVTLVQPKTASYVSGDSQFQISGKCEAPLKVTISGASTGFTTCKPDGTFVLPAGPITIDGPYTFNIVQTDAAGNDSLPLIFNWIRDTSIPPAPTLALNIANPTYSSNPNFALSGGCKNDFLVTLSGADKQTMICASSSFSFTVSKPADGNYDFSIKQTNLAGADSAPTSLKWIHDSIAPAAPVILNHPVSPFISGGDKSLTLSGSCETGTTVSLSGDAIDTQPCLNTSFSFALGKDVDGQYLFKVAQTDLAGNASIVADFTWILDTAKPGAPKVLVPSISPFISNTSKLTITGSCEAANGVTLKVVSEQKDVPCDQGSYAFEILRDIDGLYNFAITQTDLAGNISPEETFSWLRDTQPVAAPTISSPSQEPYISSATIKIEGACIDKALVKLTGDDTQNFTCSASSYLFNIDKGIDGSYNFSILQTTVAGNSSSPVTKQWKRDSTTPVAPVITSSTANPYFSKESSFALQGSCISGSLVTLSEVGVPVDKAQSCALNTFSFTIAKANDGIYSFGLKQISLSGVSSASVPFQWTRDTVAPVVTLTQSPDSTSVLKTGSFSFATDKVNSTFQCQIVAGAAAFSTPLPNCTSPLAYSNLANGSYSFKVFAVDSLGNVASTVTYNWTIQNFNTMALYHFDTATGIATDSSYYTGNFSNNLTNVGAISKTGQFSTQAARLTSTAKQYMEGKYNASYGTARKTMTVETFVRFYTLPINGASQTIANQSGALNNLGWIFQIKNVGNSYYPVFGASADGINMVWAQGKTSIIPGTSLFQYLAVTYNSGVINFYFNGGVIQASINVAPTIFESTAPLRIGRSDTADYLDAKLDELRISQVVRNCTVVPTGPFSAD